MNRIRTTIEAGPMRRVLTFALWRVVSADVVGERELSEGFYDLAWRGINPAYELGGDPGDAEYRLLRLTAVRSAVRAVAAAADGERVDLPVSPEELADALHDCVLTIDQNDQLLDELSAEDRADVGGCREAAIRLLDELADPLEALAAPMLDAVPAGAPAGLDVDEFVGSPRITRAGARSGSRA